MICKEKSCGRRAHSRGWCTTHYRRWRTGKTMGAPIRHYVEGVGDDPVITTAKGVQPMRERPWAAEYALLQELGLYVENCRRIDSHI